MKLKYRECVGLYSKDILCMDQAVPVQEWKGAV